jgi:hypothetical protein
MDFRKEIDRYVPESAVELLIQLWTDKPFTLKVRSHRTTKYGDYRYLSDRHIHLITVNASLNKFQFLFTLVHEIAHQWVRVNYKRRQPPHGKAWKNQFIELMIPFLESDIFPERINLEIRRHMANPKASTSADPKLFMAFENMSNQVLRVDDLEDGQRFRIGKKWFLRGPKRRTRYLCESETDNRKYTISAIAPVQL